MKRFIILLLFLLPYALVANEVKGIVVIVIDGDTLILVDSNFNKYNVRLSEIDAPELKQPYGKSARYQLSRIIQWKVVTLKNIHKDKYKRTLATVVYQDSDMNQLLLDRGLAWHYSVYSKNKVYAQAQATAKAQKKGLWKRKKPLPPWVFRKLKTR